jgi:hypothetical protein
MNKNSYLEGPLEFLTDRDYLPDTLQWVDEGADERVDEKQFLFVGDDHKLLLECCSNTGCGQCVSEIGIIDVNPNSHRNALNLFRGVNG